MHSFELPTFDKEQIIVHKLDYKSAQEINFNKEIIKDVTCNLISLGLMFHLVFFNLAHANACITLKHLHFTLS